MSDQTNPSIGRESALSLLKYAVAALVVGPVLTLLALGIYTPSLTVDFLGPLAMLAVGMVGWFFLAKGRVNLALGALAYGVCLATTTVAVFTGGVRSPVMVIYPVLILIYGWLSHTRAGVRLAVLVTALILSLWVGESLGWVPQASQLPASIHVVHVFIICDLAAVLMVFITQAHRHHLNKLNALSHELAQRTRLLERAQNVGRMGSWVSDIPGDEIKPSPQGCKLLGITIGAHTSYNDYLSHVHEDDREGVKSAWKAALKTGIFDGEHRVIVNGEAQWVRQRAEVEFGPDGHALSALGIVQDINEHKLTQLALKSSEERYRTLIEWTPDAILVHRHTKILYANPSALKLFGAPDIQSLLGKSTTELIHPDCLDNQQARMMRIEKGESLQPTAEAQFLKLDGTPIDVEVQGTAIEFDGEPAVHVSIRDITQRKHLEDEIRQLAFYDTLTTLPNRRLLDDRLGQTISVNRRSGCFGALMFLDLDNFKPLNDQHGHAVGDLLLREAAIRLKSCMRERDTVARFGGDEFVVLLAELDADWQKSTQYASQVAEKIKAAMAAPYTLQVQHQDEPAHAIEHRCTVSMGVVVFSSATASAQDLTKWADTAMYQAKNEGRNRICFSKH